VRTVSVLSTVLGVGSAGRHALADERLTEGVEAGLAEVREEALAPVRLAVLAGSSVSPRTTKPRCVRGVVSCAEEDSNLHPV